MNVCTVLGDINIMFAIADGRQKVVALNTLSEYVQCQYIAGSLEAQAGEFINVINFLNGKADWMAYTSLPEIRKVTANAFPKAIITDLSSTFDYIKIYYPSNKFFIFAPKSVPVQSNLQYIVNYANGTPIVWVGPMRPQLWEPSFTPISDIEYTYNIIKDQPYFIDQNEFILTDPRVPSVLVPPTEDMILAGISTLSIQGQIKLADFIFSKLAGWGLI